MVTAARRRDYRSWIATGDSIAATSGSLAPTLPFPFALSVACGADLDGARELERVVHSLPFRSFTGLVRWSMSPDKLSLVNAAGDTSSAGLGDVNAVRAARDDLRALLLTPPRAGLPRGRAHRSDRYPRLRGREAAVCLSRPHSVRVCVLAWHILTAQRRPSVLVLLSIFAAFLAVTFDLFRIFQTDNNPRDQTTRVLLILRELFLAVALFVRYLFFLEYASRWPDRARSERWPVTRVILEVFLLLVAVVMFVLQLVWRYNSRLPAVYTADVVLELCWTTLVMLKMGSSIIFFPDPSQRWRFAKLVLPIMGALLIEWGISVGNAVMRTSQRAVP